MTFFEALLRELYRIEILTPERMRSDLQNQAPKHLHNSKRHSQRDRVSAGPIHRVVSGLPDPQMAAINRIRGIEKHGIQ